MPRIRPLHLIGVRICIFYRGECLVVILAYSKPIKEALKIRILENNLS